MKTIRRPVILLGVVLMLALHGCASVAERKPLPDDFDGLARIPGMPEKSRIWGDEPPPYISQWDERTRQDLEAEFGGIMGREHHYLALSGGGADGAFGAGLLAGWSAAGTRPEFTFVTGISTGALIAPFAFLGPDYDAQLKEIYTRYATKDLIHPRPILEMLTGDSVADTKPLLALIAKYIDTEVIAKIAAEGRKGRRLWIGTTDVDADRPVIWNITIIAASGHPRAPELIHKILLASASIPVAFPPVTITVEVDGEHYDELHVDGGTTTQIFLYPIGLRWDYVAGKLAVEGKPRVYLIRNSRLKPSRRAIAPKVFSIAGHAIGSLIRTQGIGDMYRLYFGARRDGLDYNLAYIPDDFDKTPTEVFDPVYMNTLFGLGHQMAREGYPWYKAPPGLK
jgi:predicted acylesterase/phospholipase RssA